MSTLQLSSWECVSGSVIVTDPCYEKDNGFNQQLNNVVKGTWRSEIQRDGYNVSITTWIGSSTVPTSDWELQGSIGVDSGQAGIFDYDKYHDEVGNYDDENSFYGKVCKITLGPNRAGSIDFGTVSSSGYGDGIYNYYIYHNDNKEISAIKIEFICNEN